MNLSVKSRIAAAMMVVLVANIAAAMFSWTYFTKASSFSQDARAAAAMSAQASAAAERATTFVAEADSLALAVNSAENPMAASAAYGSILGADALVRSAVGGLAPEKGLDASRVSVDWEALQQSTYYWINREAEAAHSALRMTRGANGRYRASIASNIAAPAGLEALSVVQLRTEVRRQSEAFVDGALRRIARDADARAAVAALAEERARELARTGTVLLIVVSLIMAVVAAGWLYGTIVRPLDRARRFADRVAAGDLGASLEHHTSDEIGALTLAVEDMKDAVVQKVSVMLEMAGAVLVTADGVKSAAAHALKVCESLDLGDGAGLRDDIADVVKRADVLSDLSSQMLEA